MNIRYKKHSELKAQSGFTMIEILVALVLGVAILIAAISMQMQHRKGFSLSKNKLEMQTNAKLVFEFISTSLRSAGSMGCKTSKQLLGQDGDPSRINDNGCYSFICIDFNDPTLANADFRPGHEVQGYEYIGSNLSPVPPLAFPFSALGQYNKNSDALTIAGAYGEVYIVKDPMGFTDISTGFELEATNITKFKLEKNQYAMLTSCRGAKVFKLTAFDDVSGIGSWGAGGGADDNKLAQIGEVLKYMGNREGSGIELRRAAVATYFVGMHPLGDVDGVPSLYQDIDGVSKLLVEGVEEIQFLYGINLDPIKRNIADRYLTAKEIQDMSTPTDNKWREVVSVRVGIIMRSKTNVYTDAVTQNDVSLPCIDVPGAPFYYKQTPKTDRFARSTFCAEISLRNRLTGPRSGKKI